MDKPAQVDNTNTEKNEELCYKKCNDPKYKYAQYPTCIGICMEHINEDKYAKCTQKCESSGLHKQALLDCYAACDPNQK